MLAVSFFLRVIIYACKKEMKGARLMAKKTTYYLIWKRVLGKRTDKGDFIYKDGK
jgi:hypothetical protein